MLARRIVTSVCALCFAIPAVAGASPATDPPQPKGPYGITPATASRDTVKPKGPYGFTPATASRDTVKPKGPYGFTPATASRDTVKPEGPYGFTPATESQDTTGATAHPAGASRRDGTNDWRAAAISEAALLAALALGSALLLSARRRAPRMVT